MPGRIVYWDSCIFIAWLRDEQRPNPSDMDGIAYLVEEWDAGRVVIVTSPITRIEVLDSSLTPDQAATFHACFRRSTLRVDAVTLPVADLAHELRDFYADPRLCTPDALHLATAIAAECDTLYTFDGTNPSDKKKARKLLPLGPKIAGKYALATEPPRRPVTNQARLPFPPSKK